MNRPVKTRGLGSALLCAVALGGCERCSADEPELPTPAAEASGEAAGTGPAPVPVEDEASGGSGEAEEAPRQIAEGPRVVRRPEVEAGRALAAQLGLAPPDPLLVADLMTRADVRELTRFSGELLETSLEGIPASPDYNALRLQANSGYGFALQVWQFPEVRHLSEQYRRLRETYFDSVLETSGVGNEAFSADFEGIRHYAFMHRASKSMVVVTCENTLCDAAQLRALAQRVANRL